MISNLLHLSAAEVVYSSALPLRLKTCQLSFITSYTLQHKDGYLLTFTGLGNPHKNALPMCQLAFFYDLLRNSPWYEVGWKAQREKEEREKYQNKPMKEVAGFPPKSIRAPIRELFGRPVRIWIDTLCVPLDKETRTIGIKNLKRYYSTASITIVLDAELMALEHKKCPEGELLTRIALSGWMRRCWTYQEGIIASGRMRVLFKDGLYDLPETISFHRQMNSIALLMQSDLWKSKYEKASKYAQVGGTALAKGIMAATWILNPVKAFEKTFMNTNHFTDRQMKKVGKLFSKDEDPFAVLSTSDRLAEEMKSAFLALSAMWINQPSCETMKDEWIQDRTHRIAAAWTGLRFRTTSRQVDRFINFMFACAKSPDDFALLEKVLDLPSNERMRAWLLEQPALPEGILFVQGKKMDELGFRWAPSDVWPSMLEGQGVVHCVRQSRLERKDDSKEQAKDQVSRFISSGKSLLSSTKQDWKHVQNDSFMSQTPASPEGTLRLSKSGFIFNIGGGLRLSEKGEGFYFSCSSTSAASMSQPVQHHKLDYYELHFDWSSAPPSSTMEAFKTYRGVLGLVLSHDDFGDDGASAVSHGNGLEAVGGSLNAAAWNESGVVAVLVKDVHISQDVHTGTFVCRVLKRKMRRRDDCEYLMAMKVNESGTWLVS